MTWSMAEVSALATKAARGAGAPPAQAMRFGAVAAAHLSQGRDAGLLFAALDALPAGPILQCAAVLDRGMSDAISTGQSILKPVTHDALLDTYVQVLPCAARLEAQAGGQLVLHVDLARPRNPAMPRRIEGCDTLLHHMEELAGRTYVPDSATSRTSGAGAGLSDND